MSGPAIPESMFFANMPGGALPQLLPDPAKFRAASAKKSGVHTGMAGADPCGSVTRSAITGLRAKIEAARIVAQTNANDNGEGAPGAEYPGAATSSLAVLTMALDWIDQLHLWLDTNGLYVAPDDRVTNTSAAFNVCAYCREISSHLHHARHWAAVSAAWNSSRNTAQPARDCVERASEALSLLDPLAANAARCYLSAYFP
ncbi:hypothetical protein OV208_36445 [Corallococcus sp. bb12-1]|uniref:hypothetical protein n=1 Tax=Corallococcus sp. bb12-1 TaxID=2996784 RepID=UPI00226FB854|nr:hypothetical protein [Corallococcus sp. bb12-1]MCY1046852.1 hypothetical protein [Corallococcus sp. bb12-1]